MGITDEAAHGENSSPDYGMKEPKVVGVGDEGLDTGGKYKYADQTEG